MTVADQVRHAFPAYRVFIYGVNVTEDVLQAEVRWNYGRAPNTCNITLANDLDKYIFTTKDLKALFKNEKKIVAAAKRRLKLEAIASKESGRLSSNELNIYDEIFELAEEIAPETKLNVVLQKLSIRKPAQPAVEVDGMAYWIGSTGFFKFDGKIVFGFEDDPRTSDSWKLPGRRDQL